MSAWLASLLLVCRCGHSEQWHRTGKRSSACRFPGCSCRGFQTSRLDAETTVALQCAAQGNPARKEPRPMTVDLTTAPTSGPNFAAADERLAGDWDADGTVSICIPADLADRLLALQGWIIEPVGSYTKPGRKTRSQGGQAMVDYLWERDDALRLALCAEALR